MKKILAFLFLLLALSLILGCQPAPPKLEVETAEEDIQTSIAEVDALEEDLGLSEIDEIDALIGEMEEG